MKNIDWFVDNYIENKEQCEFLLEKYEIKYKYTKYQYLIGCNELIIPNSEKGLLEDHLYILGKMSMYGIKAKIAGIKLREAIDDSKQN